MTCSRGLCSYGVGLRCLISVIWPFVVFSLHPYGNPGFKGYHNHNHNHRDTIYVYWCILSVVGCCFLIIIIINIVIIFVILI